LQAKDVRLLRVTQKENQDKNVPNNDISSATFMRDYDHIQNNDPDMQAKYRGIGTTPNMLSNRVSWFFDMRGPSGSVDTACSSSLLALDLVCQSIWSGDADMGLACGNNIMLTPYTTVSLDNLGLLGKDGRCFSFDHRGNGYARGEGVGVVVVKPVAAALRDGDTIRAVIRSTCSNQDGKTPAISQPSREAQLVLIRDAYAKAGLDLGATRYFEAHGTGTYFFLFHKLIAGMTQKGLTRTTQRNTGW
jgi:acyl transferase domain-containing protein